MIDIIWLIQVEIGLILVFGIVSMIYNYYKKKQEKEEIISEIDEKIFSVQEIVENVFSEKINDIVESLYAKFKGFLGAKKRALNYAGKEILTEVIENGEEIGIEVHPLVGFLMNNPKIQKTMDKYGLGIDELMLILENIPLGGRKGGVNGKEKRYV